MSTLPNVSRRGFLRSRAAGAAARLPPARRRPRPPAASKLNAFVHVGTDDSVTLFIHKAEMGQGTVTSLSHAAGRRTGVRLEKGPHRVPRREPRVRRQCRASSAARASAPPTIRCGEPAPPRARCSSQAAAKQWGVATRGVPRGEQRGRQHRDQRASDLWQPGRGSFEASAARHRPRSRTPRSTA